MSGSQILQVERIAANRTTRHFFRHKELEFSWQTFKRHGNPDRPWTVEANTTGRVILTADEENIKAMLSNIADFGKGRRFFEMHKEFLGHGKWSLPW